MVDNNLIGEKELGIFLTILIFISLSLLVSSVYFLKHRRRLDLKLRKMIVSIVLGGFLGFLFYVLLVWGGEITGLLEPWYFAKLTAGEVHVLWFAPLVVVAFMIYSANWALKTQSPD